jgi:mono/diheme cytochrome c family protein
MNVTRYYIAVPVFSVAVLFLGFGCATQAEKPKADGKTSSAAPTPSPVPLVTNVSPPVAATPAVYVPDMTHAGEPLPTGVLNWNSLLQTMDAAADQAEAHFTFSFTNVATKMELEPATNITSITNFTTVTNRSFWARLLGNKTSRMASVVSNTNLVTITNFIPIPVAIVTVHPSCGCTTAQLPPLPWIVAPGTNGQIGITVNLAGKTGTLFKTVNVATDKGNLNLSLRITISPPVVPVMNDADRARALEAAKADRQAVFKGDCVTCHVRPGVGKYGQELYQASCAICHESEHRATMVTDLHNIKTPTNEDFWRTWITHGKPGTLMPAFSSAEGGPLNDMQIASVAAYLNATIPSKVPPPPQ